VISRGRRLDFSAILCDPLRALICSADDRAIFDVWIDGRRIVAEGVVTTIDLEAATAI